jgi:hypothetical protein
MKLAFRRVEEFMKQFGKAVKQINTAEEKVIRAPLINCDKWMPP